MRRSRRNTTILALAIALVVVVALGSTLLKLDITIGTGNSLSGWWAYMAEETPGTIPGAATLALGTGSDGSANGAVYVTSSGVAYPGSNQMLVGFDFAPVDFTPYTSLSFQVYGAASINTVRVVDSYNSVSDFMGLTTAAGSWSTNTISISTLTGIDPISVDGLLFTFYTYGSNVTIGFDNIQLIGGPSPTPTPSPSPSSSPTPSPSASPTASPNPTPTPNPTEFQVSISPSGTTELLTGSSKTFSATVLNGVLPYAFAWYMNDVATGVSTSSFSTGILLPGTYDVYVKVTDSQQDIVTSNTATLIVSDNPTYTPTPTPPSIIPVGQINPIFLGAGAALLLGAAVAVIRFRGKKRHSR